MICVDLFAGGGGFSEGARMAGATVAWAANHLPLAVEWHARNHPDTQHLCQDLHQADWSQVPSHDVLLASPCCQGHSPSRGKDRPWHEKSRSTAWAVVSCAEYHRPSHVVVENVPEFRDWILYPAWTAAMQALGYGDIRPYILDAADHGVPQNRVRLFLVCTRRKNGPELHFEPKPHQPIGPHIQWDTFRWSAVNKPGRSATTLERVRNGRARFGDRFVAPFYGSGSGLTGRSLARPLGTVTTRDRWMVVDGDRCRMLQVPEYSAAQGFRPDYAWPSRRDHGIFLCGNAVAPPQARDVLTELRRVA